MRYAKHIALVALLTLGACYKAKIHVAPPQPTTRSSVDDDNYHFSLIGIIELSSPVSLAESCPGEPVTISERVSFLGGIVNMFLGTYVPVLSVVNASVECGAGAPPPPAPPAPAPPVPQS